MEEILQKLEKIDAKIQELGERIVELDKQVSFLKRAHFRGDSRQPLPVSVEFANFRNFYINLNKRI